MQSIKKNCINCPGPVGYIESKNLTFSSNCLMDNLISKVREKKLNQWQLMSDNDTKTVIEIVQQNSASPSIINAAINASSIIN